MALLNPYGPSDKSMELVQHALDEAAPLTDEQVARCAALLGLVPVPKRVKDD